MDRSGFLNESELFDVISAIPHLENDNISLEECKFAMTKMAGRERGDPEASILSYDEFLDVMGPHKSS